MIYGNATVFLVPGNRPNGTDLHALRIFALTTGVRGVVQIAIQAAARPNPLVAKEIMPVNFNAGKEGADGAIIVIGTGNFTAMATGTAGALGHQHPFRRGDQPHGAAIDIFLLTAKKRQ